jgi:hypothetical protein
LKEGIGLSRRHTARGDSNKGRRTDKEFYNLERGEHVGRTRIGREETLHLNVLEEAVHT